MAHRQIISKLTGPHCSAQHRGQAAVVAVANDRDSVPRNTRSMTNPATQEQPTAFATNANSANSPRRQRPNAVDRFPVWARIVAGVVSIFLVIAAIFFAGFYTGRYYGGTPSDNYYGVPPGEGSHCVQTFCQPAGMAGQHCYQRYVPCPTP
jgi:hypothetical protein